MKLYLAPMEGITGWGYRKTYEKHFGHIDKYFTPFLSPGSSGNFTYREMQEIIPEHNQGMYVVPQLLTCRSEDFIWAARELGQMGYKEVNLNLGCPSGTVTAKKKGSGFLAFPDELEVFLGRIFDQLEIKISIKTRLGKENPEEFYRLLEIYNRYPVWELIIHPRVQKEFYRGQPHRDVFAEGERRSANPVCYNGDIYAPKDCNWLRESCPRTDRVMVGRGIIRNPLLACRIAGQEGEKDDGEGKLAAGREKEEGGERKVWQEDKERIKAFHHELYGHYQGVMQGERNVLFRMKELWTYLAAAFRDGERAGKKIKKARNGKEYEVAVEAFFAECEFIG